jgi:hypothetical protein
MRRGSAVASNKGLGFTLLGVKSHWRKQMRIGIKSSKPLIRRTMARVAKHHTQTEEKVNVRWRNCEIWGIAVNKTYFSTLKVADLPDESHKIRRVFLIRQHDRS